jgi:hypothetical protein
VLHSTKTIRCRYLTHRLLITFAGAWLLLSLTEAALAGEASPSCVCACGDYCGKNCCCAKTATVHSRDQRAPRTDEKHFESKTSQPQRLGFTNNSRNCPADSSHSVVITWHMVAINKQASFDKSYSVSNLTPSVRSKPDEVVLAGVLRPPRA